MEDVGRRVRHAVVLLGLLIGLVLPASGQAPAARRVALVIGNAEYEAPGALLANPVNDARAIARMLRELEFDVIEETNLSVEATQRAVDRFIERIGPGDDAVFYYSGHGMEIPDGGARAGNYLLPVDASATWDLVQTRNRSLSAGEVQERMRRAEARVRILILDACRDNPFDGRSLGRGLAAMQPRGGLVAFAAEAGATASDSPGMPNGLFTKHLLDELREPGVPAALLFEQVGRAVSRASDRRQQPAFYAAGAGGFVFRRDRAEPFRDCVACPLLVVMPGGTFEMGSQEGVAEERPVHTVGIREFAIGLSEVALPEFRAYFDATGQGRHVLDCRQQARRGRAAGCINWHDAQSYLTWLNAETSGGYRLPTEAEWEYAARQAGRLGVADMVGSVWEWVEDCWHDSYAAAPTDGVAWTSGGDCNRRVLRGGAWSSPAGDIRAAVRAGYRAGSQNANLGFRVAREVGP